MTMAALNNLDDPSREPLAPDTQLLFKPIPNVQNGGCRMLVWFPDNPPIERWGQSLPLALMFHGGGWLLGSADMVPYNQVRYLLAHGVAVASCEYRMLPHSSLKDIRADLLDAYRYVQGQINKDLDAAGSLHHVDGKRVTAMGWSAGGSNTMWLAQEVQRYNEANPDQPLPPIRALIPTYPFTKLEMHDAPRSTLEGLNQIDPQLQVARDTLAKEAISASFKVYPIYIPQRHSAIDPLLLAGIEELSKTRPEIPSLTNLPPRIKLGIMSIVGKCLPAMLLDQDAPFNPLDSAIPAINENTPPTVVVVATKDSLIPTDHSYDLYKELQARGVDSLLVECHEMDHGVAECLSGSPWDPQWWNGALRPALDFAIKRLTP